MESQQDCMGNIEMNISFVFCVNLFCEGNQSAKSKYNGVFWNKRWQKWETALHLTSGKRKFCGYFDNEIEAAKKLNILCDEYCLPHKNPETDGVPNQKVLWIFLFNF
jgi:hypothetical protein